MYVSEICAEGIFVTFAWWLKNVKSRSKIALFSNERHFEIWFPKSKIITFFWSKLSNLYKKDPVLHVATAFFLKQGETRTSHGPIPHPLSDMIKQFEENLVISVALLNYWSGMKHNHYHCLFVSFSFFVLLIEFNRGFQSMGQDPLTCG